MYIAILTHGISPFGHVYAKAFEAHGHVAEVWSMTPFSNNEYGTTVRMIGTSYFKPWEMESRWQYLKVLRPLRRAVRECRPDILLAQFMSSAGFLACLSGHRRVVVSALGTDVNDRVGSRLWRAVFRWEGRRSCFVHAVSVALAEQLTHAVGIPRDRVFVAPIGVDTQRLAMVEPGARPNTGEILCLRAHKPVYDHATLVRAVARLKARGTQCHLTFTSCQEVEATKALVREARIEDRVAFRPGYEYAELPAIMASADVYVSCSLKDGTSQSLLEALSTGTFPVVSDIEANRPWVTHGVNGFLFPVGDDAALADRLEEAQARPDLRAAAAPLSRRLAVERGDINRLVDRLLAAFERCLAK